MNFFIGEKEKWTNEGNKHEDAGSLLHNTTSDTHCLYQIRKFLFYQIHFFLLKRKKKWKERKIDK